MPITLLDWKGRILLTMCAFKLTGNSTGRKSRERASIIILSRSLLAIAASVFATSR